MSNKDDALAELIGPLGSRGKRTQSTPDPKSSGTGGLNPLDLLGLPSAQRELVNWLSRKKKARLEELYQALNKPPAEIDEVLGALRSAGYVQPVLIDGEVLFKVVFSGTVTRAARGLSQNIWTLIDQDSKEFLRQMSLFNGLSEDELIDVAANMTSKTFHRNEVILWQGAVNEHVYFIKNGLVGIYRLAPGTKESHILAYLKQGDMFGEFGMLADRNHSATATVTAMSEVTVLMMKHAECLALLSRYPAMGIALARILMKRVIDTNTRLSSRSSDAKLCLVLGARPGVGSTMLGVSIAMTLAQATHKPTVYTEYPDTGSVRKMFSFPANDESLSQAAGFDAVAIRSAPELPASVRTTLVMDRLVNAYSNIVIGITSEISANLNYMLERAGQVVIVSSPDADSWAQVTKLTATLKSFVHPEKTSLFTVISRAGAQLAEATVIGGNPDYQIPFMPDLPNIAELSAAALPEPLGRVSGALADRLGRNNQIGIYIPTTIAVNETADTTVIVEKTLAFMGSLFGGATSGQAQGVWNSDQAGLVSESVHIVRSYTTQYDLDRRLPEVLEYVESLKSELKQEAMALEVNQRLMLI